MDPEIISNSPLPVLAPWLLVQDGFAAVEFYKAAFAARETYRMEFPDGGLVSRLMIGGQAEFWLSSDPGKSQPKNPPARIDLIRMILTVADPDETFNRAIEAGAKQIFPVGEQHGWRLGRLEDPFGFHWEVGRPLAEN